MLPHNYFNGMKFIEFNQVCLGDGHPDNHFSTGKVAFVIDNITTLYQVTDKYNKLIKGITVIRDRHGVSYAVSHSFDEVKSLIEENQFV